MIPKPLRPYADALKAYEKQAIQILPTFVTEDIFNDPLKLTQSKFGGRPFLPKDRQYPVGPDGKPMVMIAQINFYEVIPTDTFPRRGLLQLYVELGFDNNEKKDYEVIHITPDEMKKEPRTDFSFLTWNEDLKEEIQEAYQNTGFDGIYTLSYTEKIDRSSHQDTRFNFLFDGKTVDEFVEAFDPQGDDISNVLEYLQFDGCKMNGYGQTEWECDYSSSKVKPWNKDDVQVLQIGWHVYYGLSMDKAINLFISPQNLQNENFEEAYLA